MSADIWMFRTDGIGDVHRPNAQCATFCQSVVVISPEDREQVERLAEVMNYAGWKPSVETMQDALREFANPTPPKPDEPTGLGAVVEDVAGHRWILVFQKGMWQREDDRDVWRLWDAVMAVRVLSEGVQS